MIRMRLSRTSWLVIVLAALSLSGLLGWSYVHEGHDHDHPADHDHALHAEEKEPEAPPPGQVKLIPEAVQQAGIETAPVVLGPLDNRVLFTGELVFNEERLAKIHSRVPGRVVQIVADYGQMVTPGEVLAIIDSVELGQAQMASRQAAARFNAAQKAYEDSRYCSHRGVDFSALRDVIEGIDEVGDLAEVRGGSTITQQAAKNLFLWQGRSFVRKALELPLALWLDRALRKRRLLEIYLNVVEWGPNGEFGVAAAALRAFNKLPRDLTVQEAALLAAALPNPHRRDPRAPMPSLRRLAGLYQGRMAAWRNVDRCVRGRGAPGAFSGTVDPGFPQKTRPNMESRARYRFNTIETRSSLDPRLPL